MLYSNAIIIAENAIKKIKDQCSYSNITGGLRRAEEEVDEIIIICCPNKTSSPDNPHADENGEVVVEGFANNVKSLGRVIFGSPYRPIMIIVMEEKIKLIIMAVPISDKYRLLAITTGPTNYVTTNLIPAWKALGWVTTKNGLRRIDECKHRGYEWRINTSTPTLPPNWDSEEDLFAWLGVAYEVPADRV